METSSKTTVVARNLHKTYELSNKGSQFKIRKNSNLDVHALKGVSFIASSGESIGVVGRNGSGKSTLFRLISGGETPTSGDIYVSSTPTLLGVSSALQGDLSGRMNIRLGLLAMGLSPSEVSAKEEEVADWAEIGDAVHRPLKTYSSGMRARLVFSISTSVKREILLVDEALSTGDNAFADRAKKRMQSFLQDTGTVFIVSHGAGTIKDYCTRALWLHDGEILMDGDATETSKAYVRWSKMRSRDQIDRADRYMQECREAYQAPTILFEDEIAQLLDGRPY